MNPEQVEAVSRAFVKIVSSIGFTRVVVSLLLIYICFLFYKLFSRHITRKDRELSDKRNLEKLQIQKDNIKGNMELAKLGSDFIALQSCILEKLDTSASLFMHNKLTRKFLGIDRDFYSTAKLRILRFYESDTKENNFSLKTEIQDVLFDKVLAELGLHTFKDDTLLTTVSKECNILIDSFFKEVASKNKDDLKEFVSKELYNLTVNISTTIENAYKSLIHNDEQIKYLTGIR